MHTYVLFNGLVRIRAREELPVRIRVVAHGGPGRGHRGLHLERRRRGLHEREPQPDEPGADLGMEHAQARREHRSPVHSAPKKRA